MNQWLVRVLCVSIILISGCDSNMSSTDLVANAGPDKNITIKELETTCKSGNSFTICTDTSWSRYVKLDGSSSSVSKFSNNDDDDWWKDVYIKEFVWSEGDFIYCKHTKTSSYDEGFYIDETFETCNIRYDLLSEDMHIITLTVTDNLRNKDSDTMKLFVTYD